MEKVDIENSTTPKLDSDDVSKSLKLDSVNVSVEITNLASHDEEISKNDQVEATALKASQNQTDISKRKSSLSKTTDSRHFQKTRSFSAVEEKSDSKISKNQLSKVEKFPLKDVAHSRSTHLEIQPHGETVDDANKSIASSSTVVDQSDLTKSEAPGNASADTPSIVSGDTLIMQFDYYSNDQPMSLQHDPRFNVIATQTDNTHLRKSVRDLTVLGTEQNAQACFGRTTETNRIIWSNPRLEPPY